MPCFLGFNRQKRFSGVYSKPIDVFVQSIKETALVLEDVSVCSHPSCSGWPADLFSLRAPLKFYPTQSNLTSRKLGHIESQWREMKRRRRGRRKRRRPAGKGEHGPRVAKCFFFFKGPSRCHVDRTVPGEPAPNEGDVGSPEGLRETSKKSLSLRCAPPFPPTRSLRFAAASHRFLPASATAFASCL